MSRRVRYWPGAKAKSSVRSAGTSEGGWRTASRVLTLHVAHREVDGNFGVAAFGTRRDGGMAASGRGVQRRGVQRRAWRHPSVAFEVIEGFAAGLHCHSDLQEVEPKGASSAVFGGAA